MAELRGRTAVITGGLTGQGREIARALAAAGGQKAEGNIWIPFEPVTRENMKDYK